VIYHLNLGKTLTMMFLLPQVNSPHPNLTPMHTSFNKSKNQVFVPYVNLDSSLNYDHGGGRWWVVSYHSTKWIHSVCNHMGIMLND